MKGKSKPVVSAEFYIDRTSTKVPHSYRWQVILACGCDVEVRATDVEKHFYDRKRFIAPKTARCPGDCCTLGEE